MEDKYFSVDEHGYNILNFDTRKKDRNDGKDSLEPPAYVLEGPPPEIYDDQSVHTQITANLSLPIDSLGFPHLSSKGKPLATWENLEHLINKYGIHCYYDEMLKREYIIYPEEALENDISANGNLQKIRSLLALNGLPEKTAERFPAIFMRRAINPVINWITSIEWDGESRLADVFNSIGVCEDDNHYRNLALRTWFIQCVASADGGNKSKFEGRLRKYESVLVFQSKQGLFKTSWFKSLLPGKYSQYILDGINLDLADKDSIKQAISAWIVELGELDSTFRKSDISRLKAFLSKEYDSLRLPYDRATSEFQRRTSFCGSVNDERFLVDTTGNRRFFPIKIESIKPLNGLNLQQFWAEVWQLYIGGEQWWPSEALEDLLVRRHQQHQLIDHIEDMIKTVFDLEQKSQIGKLYTCTEIMEVCGQSHPSKNDINSTANVLRRFGFVYLTIQGKRGFRLEKRLSEPF